MANRRDASLNGGVAGALVMAAHFYLQSQTEQRRTNIGRLIDALVDKVQNRRLPLGLWDGLTGILYAFEFLRSHAPELLSDEIAEFLDEMDDQLIAHITRDAARHFDFDGGLVGLGAYALMRTERNAAVRLYGAIERALLMQSIESGGQRSWTTSKRHLPRLAPVESHAHGHVDLGLAHGLPGVVLLGAGAIRHGIASASTAQWLSEAVAALIGYRRDRVAGAVYPYYSSQRSHHGSRLGWCYGDVSAGFAIHSAARVLRNEQWLAIGGEIIRERCAQAEETFLMEDHSLCHGEAGAMHMANKMNASAAHPIFTAFAQARKSKLHAAGAGHMQPGLLTGSAGMLMALEDGPDRGRHHWDVCMYLGF